MIGPLFHHPGILAYDFGPSHPLRPERMRRTLELLARWGIVPERSPEGEVADLHRVHDPAYVDTVFAAGRGTATDAQIRRARLAGDNPVFPGMGEAALAYVGGVAEAARRVRDGAPLAICLDGGLHHAFRAHASGFCLFNDAAIALSILRERFERVAYVDIDVHHGDGVESLFWSDSTVLTCSIHESGRTLFPGTGWIEDTGTDLSALNVPLPALTGADAWLFAFRETVLPKLRAFDPQALVLQMGTDIHALDPLGHLRGTQNVWLDVVRLVKELGLPLVAVGGGGYNLGTVPRMWASAVATLNGIDVSDALPADLADAWGVARLSDEPRPDADENLDEVTEIIRLVRATHHLDS